MSPSPVAVPLLFVYVLSFGAIFSASGGGLFQVLAYIPPTAPVASTTLYAICTIGLRQAANSAVICLAATVATARVAATIYERSILPPELASASATRSAAKPPSKRSAI